MANAQEPGPGPAGSGSVTALRRLAADALALLRIRLEIFSLEAQEQAGRWATLFLMAWAAVQLLCIGLVFVALALVAAWWDTHPVRALSLAAAGFVAAACALGGAAWRAWKTAPPAFPVTRGELSTDTRWLDDRPPPP